MSISSAYHTLPTYQGFNHLGAESTESPSTEQLNTFVQALNENGHLPYTVCLEQVRRAPYVQIIHDYQGNFIAGSTIKCCDGEVAEIGFMLVDKKYRQLGLAERMTKDRISYARKLGIKMLYAKVRGKNIKSMNNLRKAGFQSSGDYLSQKDLYSTVSWFYLSLGLMSDTDCQQRLRKNWANLVPVIGQVMMLDSADF
ncbi:MAG: GNAT family N-acetyltransferase [Methyloprofundus sp.]|nr:GNAT family N-acetyltransferase [Methyloprofundus sp.]